MKQQLRILGILTFCMALTAPGLEIRKGAITSAGLFKNGLTYISQEYAVPGPGEFTFESLPDPIHGTLWIESPGTVTARMGVQEVSLSPEEIPVGNPGDDLLGQHVRLRFKNDQTPWVAGRLLAAPAYAPLPASTPYFGATAAPTTPPNGYIVLGLGSGHRAYYDPSIIASMSSEGDAPDFARTTSKPVLTFTVPPSAEGPMTIRAKYLTRGLSWAPTYHLDLSDEALLRIEQTAVLRNELSDLTEVPFELISGFPSVEFANVVSPLAATATWSSFFQQLAQQPADSAPMMTQQMVTTNNAANLFQFSSQIPMDALHGPEGPDIYYHPIGTHSLKKGEALSLQVELAEVPYERIVEWRVSEDRDAPLADDLWNAVLFKNPFEFPMTTGPAMVTQNGRFLGSRTSHWVNPGSEALVYVTKALSIQTKVSETETVPRTQKTIANRSYWLSMIDTKLHVTNLRPEAVRMRIQKDVVGELGEVDGEPERVVGKAGPGRTNPSTTLRWDLSLAAGETRELAYRYSYLNH